jgi:glutathione S-transferase
LESPHSYLITLFARTGTLRGIVKPMAFADWVAEVHDNYQPVVGSLYYEEQKREAKRRTENFTAERLPKFLSYFEQVLERNGSRVLVGNAVSYVDLSLFEMIESLR